MPSAVNIRAVPRTHSSSVDYEPRAEGRLRARITTSQHKVSYTMRLIAAAALVSASVVSTLNVAPRASPVRMYDRYEAQVTNKPYAKAALPETAKWLA